MALLQDQEVRLKRALEKNKQKYGRANQIASGFVFGTIVAAGILILLTVYLVSPNTSFFGLRPAGYDARLTNKLVGTIHQGAETVLPTQESIEAIRSKLGKSDFAILTSPDVQSTRANTVISYDLRIVRGEGFSEPVTLAATNLPESLAAAAAPTVVKGNEETASVQITVPGGVPVGNYNFTIVAEAKNTQKEASAGLSVSNFSINNPKLIEVKPMEAGTKWQAVIGWETDVQSNTWVEYAPENSFISGGLRYAFTVDDQSNTKVHAITLSYLEPGTVYHYRLRSVDDVNNIVVGNDRAFITQAAK